MHPSLRTWRNPLVHRHDVPLYHRTKLIRREPPKRATIRRVVPGDSHPRPTPLPSPSSPRGACARADSIIVSQIRPSHYASLLLTTPRLQRYTASAIIHPWDSQIHRFRDAYRVFIRGGRKHEGRDRTFPKDPREETL